MAGPAGFEPANAGTKTQCLTTWRRSITRIILPYIFKIVKRTQIDYNIYMIKIIAGGKKHPNWLIEATSEYDKRLHKPWNMEWVFMEEEKLNSYLETWPFSGNDYVIIADERGQNISSPEFAAKLDQAFLHSKNIIIIIGGAYGFSENIRNKANFLWSFSKLVFPHQIARLIVAEQIYRANQILNNTSYHHE